MIPSLAAAVVALLVPELAEAAEAADAGRTPWWVWPLLLFVVTFLVAIVSVVAGLGGGTLFVPLVGGFFPFHLDFVRAAGLIVALAGALAAGPTLLERRLADFRLALPVALVASASAIVGAVIGLALPSWLVQTSLGALVILIVVVNYVARRSDYPVVAGPDRLAAALRIAGVYYEPTLGREISWTIHRTWLGLTLFVGIGMMAGAFGIGAGWANVATLNLVMGAPIKVAAGTSVFLLSLTDTAAAWVYINEGAVLPIVVVPSVMGMVIGSKVGVRLLAVAQPGVIRMVMGALLLFAGLRSLSRGLGLWP